MGGIPTQLGRMLWGKERGKESRSRIRSAPLRERWGAEVPTLGEGRATHSEGINRGRGGPSEDQGIREEHSSWSVKGRVE